MAPSPYTPVQGHDWIQQGYEGADRDRVTGDPSCVGHAELDEGNLFANLRPVDLPERRGEPAKALSHHFGSVPDHVNDSHVGELLGLICPTAVGRNPGVAANDVRDGNGRGLTSGDEYEVVPRPAKGRYITQRLRNTTAGRNWRGS